MQYINLIRYRCSRGLTVIAYLIRNCIVGLCYQRSLRKRFLQMQKISLLYAFAKHLDPPYGGEYILRYFKWKCFSWFKLKPRLLMSSKI